jgi:hypothetical protein
MDNRQISKDHRTLFFPSIKLRRFFSTVWIFWWGRVDHPKYTDIVEEHKEIWRRHSANGTI